MLSCMPTCHTAGVEPQHNALATAEAQVQSVQILTDRARCRCAAALPPEGRIKFLKGGSWSSMASSQA